MPESWINLSCPTCEKQWSTNPSDLDGLDADLVCPDCATTAATREFFNSSRDLEIVKSLAD